MAPTASEVGGIASEVGGIASEGVRTGKKALRIASEVGGIAKKSMRTASEAIASADDGVGHGQCMAQITLARFAYASIALGPTMPKKTPPKKASTTPKGKTAKATAPTGKPKPATGKAKTARAKKTASSSIAGAPTPPTQAEMDLLMEQPVLTTDDIVHLTHAPAGFESVAKQVLADWQEIASQLQLPGLSVEALEQALATLDLLWPIELKIEPYYQRARTNRMKAASIAVSTLYALARAVKGAGNAALAQRFATLLAWIANTHTPNKPAKKKKAATGAKSAAS
jgi:hypothetical protein